MTIADAQRTLSKQGVDMERSVRVVSQLIAMGAALLSIVVVAGPAQGLDHNYANGYEGTANNFTGLRVTRTDTAASTPNTGCTAGSAGYFQGDPIYETQWVMNDAADNWLELGTGHQCNGDKNYRFMGYGYNGGWFFLDGNGIGNGVQHTFVITRGSDTSWEFKIDGTTVETFIWDRDFGQVSTGVESYAPLGLTAGHNFKDLAAQYGGGTSWTGWAGTDAQNMDDPPMCGGWNSATSYRAGQESTC